MILKVFAVLDVKVAAYLQPFFMRTAGEAVRAFTGAVNSPETQFGKNPEDYSLFELGEFNDMNGLLTALDHPKQVIKASDVHYSVRDKFETECG